MLKMLHDDRAVLLALFESQLHGQEQGGEGRTEAAGERQGAADMRASAAAGGGGADLPPPSADARQQEANPYRSLGDAMERWMARLAVRDGPTPPQVPT